LRFSFVATIERQQTLCSQTMKFGQVKADPWLFYCGYRAVQMTKRIRRPARS